MMLLHKTTNSPKPNTQQANTAASSAASRWVLLLFGAGLLLRLAFAATSFGFSNDTACFAAWAERMYEVGPGGFYDADFFADYPPGYLYILYFIGALCHLFQISSYSGTHLMLLKLPAILCDLACSYVLYREAGKRYTSRQTLYFTAAYFFNPAIILNSSLWGQVDSVFTLTIVLLCLYLIKGKMLPAYIVFGIGILLKPQTLVFTPVLLVGILDYVFLKDFSLRKLLQHLAEGICVLLGMVLLCLPYGLDKVFAQYTSTLGSYPYVTVNGYNFWALLGLNWVSQENRFLCLSYRQWGMVVIVLIVIFALVIGLRNRRDNTKYPLIGAFTILTMFLFSVRMHERYMYPGLILLLLCILYKPLKATIFCYIGFSLLHYYNTLHILYYYNPTNFDAQSPVIRLISAGMVVCICCFYYVIWKYYGKEIGRGREIGIGIGMGTGTGTGTGIGTEKGNGKEKEKEKENQKRNWFRNNSDAPLFTRLDAALLLAITLLYSGFALYDLGDMKAPETTYDMTENQSILLDFGTQKLPSTMSYYIAPWHDRQFTMEIDSEDMQTWTSLGEITLQSVFTWQEIPIEIPDEMPIEASADTTAQNPTKSSARYLKLTLHSTQASLLELVFTDEAGNRLLPQNTSEYPALFDENELYSGSYSFRNSMYFDEIYHARTAYEYLNGLYSYENTHPPLGKIFIALGVWLFGMNPFGWRIIGTLFGIAMLPFLYLFGKRITGQTWGAALSCFLFAFDFMHFTQTRIATIDVYITFFVIVMYYFMYCYCTGSFYNTTFRRTLLPLGICGVAMGLGVASKWTGAYAGVGLAVLFFSTLGKRYLEYRHAKKQPEGSTEGIAHQHIIRCFAPYTKKTIAFCLLFFVAIPACIYLLSYLPFVNTSNTGLFDRMLQNQVDMFDYHSKLDATHAFSSSWNEWPTMIRPVWYYANAVSDTLREGISAFGNPLVWWAGIPAFGYILFLFLAKKDKIAGFLTVGYLAQYLPWFFVTRITFLYHYFPSVAFVVLMIVYCLAKLKEKIPQKAFILLIIAYAIGAFGLFLLFYPVLAGQPIDGEFARTYLRWLHSWVLVSA